MSGTYPLYVPDWDVNIPSSLGNKMVLQKQIQSLTGWSKMKIKPLILDSGKYLTVFRIVTTQPV